MPNPRTLSSVAPSEVDHDEKAERAYGASKNPARKSKLNPIR